MECVRWTDVFDGLDVHPSAAIQITSLSAEDYELATSDITEFFEVSMTMIRTQ